MKTIVDRRDEIVAGMEQGTISPCIGYRMLKYTWALMTECERATDHCRSMIALDDHDSTDMMDRLGW